MNAKFNELTERKKIVNTCSCVHILYHLYVWIEKQ